jgi:tetratricopeptide (TPR) repeat protein
MGKLAYRCRMLVGVHLVMLLVAGGCANPTGRTPAISRAIDDYNFGRYDAARTALQPLAAKTNNDYVLNNVRLGSVALAEYDLAEAESAFFRAYEVINSTKVNDLGRATVAALFSENAKVWRGEPFERAMVNFYLGLIYYMQHDYSNARAAFENALFKLRDYSSSKDDPDQYGEVESDFALALIMLGRSWQRLGREDHAADAFARAAELRPDLAALADERQHARSNVLLVIEFGQGPEKMMAGDVSTVAFYPHPSQAPSLPKPRVSVDGGPIHLGGLNQPTIDLLEMAQDRRWQSIDTIRLTKSVIGTGLMAAGAYQGVVKDDAGSAAALLAAGLLTKMSATADLRHWEMLPRTVYVIPLYLSPGRHDVTVAFGSNHRLAQTWRGIVAPDGGDATYFIRISPTTTGEHDWPPPKFAGAEEAERISRGE